MPGNAITDNFMLSTATVMIGEQADLFDLNPAEHSIGLVKNFTITAEPAYTELTQGVQNTIVASVLTGNPVRATMEAYEFTSKNLAYALGLEGAGDLDPLSVATETDGGSSPSDTTLILVAVTDLAANDFVMIKRDNEDNFDIRKITNVNVGTKTITLDKPLTDAVPDGTPVIKVNMVSGGSKKDQPYYAAKIAGKLSNGQPIVLLLPKVRIVKGFNLAFTTDNFGNLPLEFTSYDQVSTDPFYTDFAGDQFRIFAAK